MKKITFSLLIVLLLLLGSVAGVAAQTETPPAPGHLTIYFFWGDGCPHCAEMEPFLEELVGRYPGLEVKAFEVWKVPANQALFDAAAKVYGFEPQGVPTIFMGPYYNIGYDKSINTDLENGVKTLLEQGTEDKLIPLLAQHPNAKSTFIGSKVPAPTAKPPQPGPTETVQPGGALTTTHELNLPLIGKVNLDKESIWITTILIAIVDGVNPCSMWVLTVLLALTLHTGSRKKVFIIGLVFITVTAFIYALFIAGLFSVLKVISFMGWIQVVVAIVALFFGLVNIKDYFWYKEGISFTIADSKKSGIFAKVRKVMDASESLWGLIGATIVLAAGVSLVEFSCTAGFPVLWTNMLNAQHVGTGLFLVLLLVYMLIYQADELAIFMVAVYSLRASKLEEKHGRILKLIGGCLMLVLAAVMIINPSLMNSITSSLVIFGVAFLLAILILIVHRRILPAMGIWIGTEERKASQQGKGRKR